VELARRGCWIFDLDGTLTVAVHDFDAIRTELGLPQGRPILEELAGLPDERARPLYRQLGEIELELARAARPAAGAERLLETLAGRGARLGILTRNSCENALETLRAAGLQRFFAREFLVGRETAAPKPSPAGVQKLLAGWSAAADDALMIGDYLYDLQAGRAAGTATVYVDTTGRFPFAEHADLRVECLEELLER
jgi:HAD superfamily hydrolase (TIGR01509 family)